LSADGLSYKGRTQYIENWISNQLLPYCRNPGKNSGRGNSMEEYVRICTLEHEIEARLLAGVLDEQAIPYRLQSYHDTAYDGLFQASQGWGALYSLPCHRDIIIQFLSEIRQSPSV
jgi:hypothetical protein